MDHLIFVQFDDIFITQHISKVFHFDPYKYFLLQIFIMSEIINKRIVKVTLDIYCFWLNHAPDYRIYVNEELFVDRTFHWDKNKYLQENIVLNAPAGLYTIRVDHNSKHIVEFNANNLQIIRGNAKKISDREFEIL